MNKPLVQRPKLGMPKKEKPWTHQDELKALRGKEIDIAFIGMAGWSRFVLLEADAFTLQVCNVADKTKSILTYFKHQIRGYKAG